MIPRKRYATSVMATSRLLTLPNGIRIVLAPEPTARTASIFVAVAAGSEYERKEENGVSHFLEHLMFKGTTSRSTPGAVAQALDGLGAEYNAATSQQWTAYYAKVRAARIAEAVDLITDLYRNPVLDPHEIDKERGVIIEEINMYADDPRRKVHDLFGELLYGDQPAGWDVAGPKEVIRTITPAAIRAYRDAHYRAGGTVIVVAGGFSSAAIRRQLIGLWRDMPALPAARKTRTKEVQRAPAVRVQYKASDQAHLVLGFRAFSMFDERRFTLRLLAHVLGGGMSSRLFYRIREELGAAYYVHADADLTLDHGALAIAIGADTAKVETVITAAAAEVRRLATDLVPPAELRRAREHLISGMVMGLETSDELASFYGLQELLAGERRSLNDVIAHLRAVTPAMLRKVARMVSTPQRTNLAIIGPYRRPDTFMRLIS